MAKKFNLIEKKLKFHCSHCLTTWQLLIIRTDLLTNKDKCLNNCLEKWKALLVEYCQEQIILDMFNKEKEKSEKEKIIAEWIKEIKKNESK
jgi:hypothetical protein